MHFKLLQNGIKAKRKVIVFSIGTKYKYSYKAIRIVLQKYKLLQKELDYGISNLILILFVRIY